MSASDRAGVDEEVESANEAVLLSMLLFHADQLGVDG